MKKNGKKVRPKVAQRVLQRQQEKERAKIAKEVDKLQQLNAGDSNPHIQQLQSNLSELTKHHNELVDAFNSNNRNYNNQLQHLDMRLGAAYSVLQDMFDGNVQSRTMQVEGVDKTLRIDWPAYIENYLETVRAEVAKQLAAEKEAAVQTAPVEVLEESPLITPLVDEPESDEPDTVFGGDHVQTQQPAAT